jgi:hypothetical protein
VDLMPYVITTNRQDERPSRVGYADDMRVISRRAVATLEEARRAVRTDLTQKHHVNPVGKHMRDISALFNHNMREHGKHTVGPLPDGTVIEVARVRWDVIREEALKHQSIDRYPGDGGQPVIDAYNARES